METHNFNTLIVSDYWRHQVHYFKVSEELLKTENMEDILEFLGFRPTMSKYLIVDDDTMDTIEHKGIITKIEEE